ncbi:MAG: hydrogenase expression/formation protein HypE [bacterium]|nr:hydrogenase expression/formation protein HypE [bacterium]
MSERKRKEEPCITMAHGGGGEMTQKLLKERIIPKLANDLLNPLNDSAVLPQVDGRLCMTTDSFVVQPLEFPGGDIGHLAVCGTVNDLVVMGAKPLALSLGMIIEEGLPLATLDRMVDSIAATAREAGVVIATGDTKVIERGKGDGLMINTAGIGVMRDDVELDASRIEEGDLLLINGNVADHGLAVMSVREHLEFDTDLLSDAAPLGSLIDTLLAAGGREVKFLRDPTRGGLSGVLCDLAADTGFSVEIEEANVPISRVALHTAELLGLDPLSVANEGKVVAVIGKDAADAVLSACKAHPLGGMGALIGRFTTATPPLVELITRGGGRRMVTRPYGEELPRIC